MTNIRRRRSVLRVTHYDRSVPSRNDAVSRQGENGLA